jgi:hypothetical protein
LHNAGTVRDLLGYAALLLVVACAAPRPASAPAPPSRAGAPCPLDDPGPPPAPEDAPVPAPRKQAWEEARGGREAARPFVRARLQGWPAHERVPAAALPADDDAFLHRLAADTWRGLDAFRDRENGLPVDHVRVGRDGGDWEVGDYVNVSTIGLYLAAVVAAHELALVDAAGAESRLTHLLATVEELETHRGHLFNYYDTTSRERTSRFLSFVDTGWLTAGLMVVRAAFPALAPHATRLIERMDLGFFYDRRSDAIRHGYRVERRAFSRYHYGMLYTEARLPILVAIGKGDVPESAWYTMTRTYPPECRGQTLAPRAIRTRIVRGHRIEAGVYEWGGVAFVPSWGGSMFEALMPALLLDEPRLTPQSFGANDRAHAVVQRRYASEVLGLPVWGTSPSAIPGGRGYAEYGVPVLGARGYAAGAVTPHAAVLALAVTAEAARANLRQLVARYDVYGDFGLYDAVDPRDGRVADTYLALDQSMILIALANHLRDGAIQRRFESDPIARRILSMLAAEGFF